MKERLMKLSTPWKLAILAGLLGFIALLIGNPSNRNVIDVNAKEMALATVKNHDRIVHFYPFHQLLYLKLHLFFCHSYW